ncbi:MAG: sce7726 family protein [Nitrosomonadales bacterium]|nr:sce7726 family protein [Nitrosomonadales bacterium]
MSQSSDTEIRKAFHAQKLKDYHNCQNTIVIDELGLIHGRNRIDIAVFNGCLHGYEIKSAKDNLERFPDQLSVYRECLEKLTFVVAPNHLEVVFSMSPQWCGVLLAEKGPRGGISFSTIRRAQKNPEINLVSFAHLLWKNEAIELLGKLGIERDKQKVSRSELYKQLTQLVSIDELSVWVKEQFMKRETWRVAPQLLQDGGSLQLASRQ